jgi:hypothetical protein
MVSGDFSGTFHAFEGFAGRPGSGWTGSGRVAAGMRGGRRGDGLSGRLTRLIPSPSRE